MQNNCAPTICQSNPYLTTKISTLQIKVISDLVVWYNFWANMPSCLTFGSLVATAILFDFDLDERINPNAYAYTCRGCLSIRLFMWGCACLWDVWYVAKITTKDLFARETEWERKRAMARDSDWICTMSETLWRLYEMHLICCFGCLLVWASENAFTCIPNFAAG